MMGKANSRHRRRYATSPLMQRGFLKGLKCLLAEWTTDPDCSAWKEIDQVTFRKDIVYVRFVPAENPRRAS
jgi:hypothetical protein